ncbi:SPOR domain-containing protein [Vibrio anguillarum]|uniref:SPOR domain-containing protein n=1 Tax=Vibrio anguillarum TaxID=55601 RepID=UPI00188B1129|nr:SPOR domain-containing protein [Vibrio anguillarum]MBF4336317.1 SPOR domain-containing protein [Vibrio anguillarum]
MMTLMRKTTLCLTSSLMVLASLALFQPAWAEDFLCDATQASVDQLPILDKACPIGQGLWGKKKPKGQSSTFWIQCGVLNKPLSLLKAKAFYTHISTDVWLKPEAKTYRCLIGPYTDYEQVKKELPLIQQIPGYKEAFIREVVKGRAQSSSPIKKTTSAQATSAAKQITKKSLPKPQVEMASSPLSTKPSTKAPALNVPPAVEIRLSTTANGLQFVVPHLRSSDEQFYMEHGLAWSRLNYEVAEKTCQKMAMRLVTEEEWQRLLDSKQMDSNQWPMHLPYWGWSQKGLFTNGKVSQLKGSSLLNVICVK